MESNSQLVHSLGGNILLEILLLVLLEQQRLECPLNLSMPLGLGGYDFPASVRQCLVKRQQFGCLRGRQCRSTNLEVQRSCVLVLSSWECLQ